MSSPTLPPEPESDGVDDAAVTNALATRGDWAGLVRYWMGRGYGPALEQALAMLHAAAQIRPHPSALVLEWLLHAPPVATEQLPIDAELLESLSPTEAITLQLRSLHSMSVLWTVVDSAPRAERDKVLELSIAATLAMLEGADLLDDEILMPCLALRWMDASARFLDESTVEVVAMKIIDDLRAKTASRPTNLRPFLIRELNQIADAHWNKGRASAAWDSYHEALTNIRELPQTARETGWADEQLILLKIGALAMEQMITQREPLHGDLVEIGDWAKLCRIWMASGDSTAIERALELLRTPQGKWSEQGLAIAEWIAAIPEQDTMACSIPPSWRVVLQPAEFATLQIMSHRPVYAYCSSLKGYSTGEGVTLLPLAITLRRNQLGLARILGDGALFLNAVLELVGFLSRYVETQSLKDNLKERLRLLEEALQLTRPTETLRSDPFREMRSRALFSLGRVLMESNRAEEARELYVEGLRICEQMYGLSLASHEEGAVATCLRQWAENLLGLGLERAARDILAQALEILRRLSASDPRKHEVDLATTLISMADIHWKIGARNDANSFLLEGQQIVVRLFAAKSATTSKAKAAKADLLAVLDSVLGETKRMLLGSSAKASASEATAESDALQLSPEIKLSFDERWNLLTGIQLARATIDELPCQSSDQDLALRRQSLALSARFMRAQGSAEGYAAAFEKLWAACRLVERLREKSSNSEERHRVLVETAGIFEMHVQNCIELWEASCRAGSPRDDALSEAVWAAEACRSRQLLDQLSSAGLKPARVTPEIEAQLEEFDRRIEEARSKLERPNTDAHEGSADVSAVRLGVDDDSATRARGHAEQEVLVELESLQRAKAEYVAHLRQIDPDAIPESTVLTQDAVADLASNIQATISADLPTALVEYALGKEASFALLALPDGRVLPVRLPALLHDQAAALAARWSAGYARAKDALRGDSHDALACRAMLAGWSTTLSEVLQDVCSAAVEPVVNAIAAHGLSIARLVIAPHRELHIFPLHACRLADGRLFGDAYEVNYTPSFSMLYRCTERTRSGDRRLVLFDEPTRNQIDEQGRAVPRLIFCAAETQAITRRLGSIMMPILLSADDATRDALIANAEAARVLHYSGHASFDDSDPLQSKLDLSGEALRLGEVFSKVILSNNALTVLNGCESGQLRPDAVDDHVSFTTGFLFAGAPCVITTLWVVPDLPGALIMDEFYVHWMAGASPAAALRAAQKRVRELRFGMKLDAAVERLTVALGSDEAKRGRRDDSRRYVEDYCSGSDIPFADPVFWAAFTCNGLGFRRLE